jgi:molybdopterin/thiamine biosynthesis adenylyltransferase
VSADLSESELQRYAAQIQHTGIDAQLRLKAARAIVIGAGPAGSIAAAALASRGVGYVAVVDGSSVQPADLVGQAMLYSPDVGANRAEAVVAKLGLLNPHVHAESYPVDVDAHNAAAIVLGHDIALDCTRAGEHLAAACAAADVQLLRAEGGDILAGAAAATAAIERLVAPVAQEVTTP